MTKSGLTLKFLKTIPYKNIVKVITEMVSQKLFVLHLHNKKSKKRRLASGNPQGLVLTPMLFNIFTADIPLTNGKKYRVFQKI